MNLAWTTFGAATYKRTAVGWREASVRVLWLTLTWSMLSLVSADEAAARRTKDAETSSEQVALPIQIFHGYLVFLKGRIGTLNEQNLLVDTGTAPSIINASVAKRLELTASQWKMETFSGSTAVQAALIPDMEFGPVRSGPLHVLVSDLSPFEKELGIPIGAVIGLDVLGSSDFRLDYEKKRMVFGKLEETGIQLPFETAPPLVTVSITVGNERHRMLVDTGAAGMLFFEDRVSKGLGVVSRSTKRSGMSLSGDYSADEINTDQIFIGGKRTLLTKAYLISGARNQIWPYDGLLGTGTGALDLKSLTFHFKKHLLSLQR